jgi:sulfhydrogenase subunit beta (sulfur reductase)
VQQAALDKKNLSKLVAAMLKQGTVRGPVRDAQTKSVVLGDLSPKNAIVFDYANFKLPPKREFFPQCEVIARYDAAGILQEAARDEKVILFGIRPCDVRSLGYLDKVFADAQYTDPYYQMRRDNALIIALACAEPGHACFCFSVDGGPATAAGADVMAFDLGNSLVFEAVSEKGEAFLKKNKVLLRAPTAQELQKRKQQEEKARKSLPELRYSGSAGVPKAINKNFNSPLWDAISETCLGCGACTYLCPTCHCFDLYDEKQEAGGMKIRVHDACMFASFTREASGHNPRGKRGERMRQRVMHKFSYAPENFGDIFCVGCGRCVVNCPSNIDIRETVSRVIQ